MRASRAGGILAGWAGLAGYSGFDSRALFFSCLMHGAKAGGDKSKSASASASKNEVDYIAAGDGMVGADSTATAQHPRA